jgi:hypothetical protein
VERMGSSWIQPDVSNVVTDTATTDIICTRQVAKDAVMISAITTVKHTGHTTIR